MKLETFKDSKGEWGIQIDGKYDTAISMSPTENAAINKALATYPIGIAVHSMASPEHFSNARPKKPLYQVLAALVGAWTRCQASTANESQKSWKLRHEERILALVKEHMPSGSGFDCGTKIDLALSTQDKLVFQFSYHHMDEHGGYDGWTEHEVHVVADLQQGMRLRITGHERHNMKDHAWETYDQALRQLVDEYPQPKETQHA